MSAYAPNPMIRTATTPAPPNMAIGPQLRPWLTLTVLSGLRLLPPPALAGGRPVGGFTPGRLLLVDAFAAVLAPGRPSDLGSVVALAGGSESITSSFAPAATAAWADLFEDGRRMSPVLMLMGPFTVGCLG